jgi:hypothetical protein
MVVFFFPFFFGLGGLVLCVGVGVVCVVTTTTTTTQRFFGGETPHSSKVSFCTLLRDVLLFVCVCACARVRRIARCLFIIRRRLEEEEEEEEEEMARAAMSVPRDETTTFFFIEVR